MAFSTFKTFGAAALLISSSMQAQASQDSLLMQPSLFEVIENHEKLDTFESLIDTKNSKQALSSIEHSYTVIAPTDKAYDGATPEALEALSNQAKKGTIPVAFERYIIPRTVDISDLGIGESVNYETLSNETVTFTRIGSGEFDYVINNKNIDSFRSADNGMIFIIKDHKINNEAASQTFSSLSNWF